MNNKKYSKIIVFALSLALLIGAAVGIVANAENSVWRYSQIYGCY